MAEDNTVKRETQETAEQASGADVWAAMSHEIRTPLTGILGMLEVLMSTSLTDEQRRIISTAEQSSMALMRIVNDVLDLARLRATDVEFELQPTDVGELLEECADFLSKQAEDKRLLLTCRTDGAVPLVVCDPIRLRQVILNIAGNAIKYTDMGYVALSFDFVETSANRVNLKFCVDDSGIGVPEDLHAFLFQPFSQIKDMGVRGRGGVGLGLAICRILVEAMGGSIAIESKQERGTRFIIEIPFDRAPHAAGDIPALIESCAGLNIIVVDSGERVLQIARGYLEDAGAQVSLLSNLNDLSSLKIGYGGADLPSAIIIGPDSELSDVKAVASTLSKVGSTFQPHIVWLHSHVLGGPGANEGYDIRTVRAYPLRRSTLLSAVLGAPLVGQGADETLKVMRRMAAGGASLIREDKSFNRAPSILVAEDNPINQEVLSQQLAVLGLNCDVAANGDIALRMMEEKPYDILLCDCHMPGMDGFELTRILRKREEEAGGRIPIIAITANALPGEAAKCKAQGMDDFLTKPIEISTLSGVLEKWLDTEVGARTSDASHANTLSVSGSVYDDEEVEEGVSTHFQTNESGINLRNLQSLYGDDEARLMSVLSQWTRAISEATHELKGALSEAHREYAIEAVHRIKGSAGIAGASKLSEAAASLEKALRLHDEKMICAESARVQQMAEQAMNEVSEWVRARGEARTNQAAL